MRSRPSAMWNVRERQPAVAAKRELDRDRAARLGHVDRGQVVDRLLEAAPRPQLEGRRLRARMPERVLRVDGKGGRGGSGAPFATVPTQPAVGATPMPASAHEYEAVSPVNAYEPSAGTEIEIAGPRVSIGITNVALLPSVPRTSSVCSPSVEIDTELPSRNAPPSRLELSDTPGSPLNVAVIAAVNQPSVRVAPPNEIVMWPVLAGWRDDGRRRLVRVRADIARRVDSFDDVVDARPGQRAATRAMAARAAQERALPDAAAVEVEDDRLLDRPCRAAARRDRRRRPRSRPSSRPGTPGRSGSSAARSPSSTNRGRCRRSSRTAAACRRSPTSRSRSARRSAPRAAAGRSASRSSQATGSTPGSRRCPGAAARSQTSRR